MLTSTQRIVRYRFYFAALLFALTGCPQQPIATPLTLATEPAELSIKQGEEGEVLLKLVQGPDAGTPVAIEVRTEAPGVTLVSFPTLRRAGDRGPLRMAVARSSSVGARSSVVVTATRGDDKAQATITVVTLAGDPLVGTLSVKVAGVSPAVADATIEGPNGFVRTISGSVEIPDLPPGEYVVRAREVRETDAVAPRVFRPKVPLDTVNVVAGAITDMSIGYDVDPTTGYVFVVTMVDPPTSVGPLRSYVRTFRASDWKTGGRKTPLNVAEIPDCRPGWLYLSVDDKLWIHCGRKNSIIDVRRYSLAALRTQALPVPESTLGILQARSLKLDRDGHFWSWAPGDLWMGRHPDSDFTQAPDIGVVRPTDAGFSRGLSDEPRFFLGDGSLLTWNVTTGATSSIYPASMLTSGGPVAATAVGTYAFGIGGGYFGRIDGPETALRWGQQLLTFSTAAILDGGAVVPLRTFNIEDTTEELIFFDASQRLWLFSEPKDSYLAITPDQLRGDSGTVMTPAWEVSWPPLSPDEQYGHLMFYPPSFGQRSSGP